MTAPTTLRGYVDSDAAWAGILADFGEHVPDLLWPESVSTYSQMRRDPQLAAILAGYTLPIRRATWQVNPAGCRPEVVQVVADDLGLPVAGQDEPGAARVRGVSWTEHLRASLLHLIYGHMGFEQQAEIRDVDGGKQARLVMLSERMPYTISEIRVNRDGSLAGIDQTAIPGDRSNPEIAADRLVWYCHEREGAAWQGSSLLRPAFAPWLLKREMQRVHATSNRRFGMGVPTVRALPGTAPTPAQMAEASRLAQDMRAGDRAGASVPPNFVVELIGLSGGTPDTLGFMRWLDQQMSRMALAGFLDLGDTTNGSRALGESFVDLFLLSIQSIADYIADVATRQIAARLVGWNWGEGEPVPAVQVADVGSRREVTAEALNTLLTSGALSADPELENWVRREFRLPARPQDDAPAGRSYEYDLNYGVLTVDERRAQIGLPPLPNGEGNKLAEPAQTRDASPPASPAKPPAAPQASRCKPIRPAGQMALPIAAADTGQRDLTAQEQASGVDPAQVQADHQQAQDDLAGEWEALGALITAALVAAAVAALPDLPSLGALVVPDKVIVKVTVAIETRMVALAEMSAQRVVEEAARQGVTVTPEPVDAALIGQHAQATARMIANGYAAAAARTALLNAGTNVDPETLRQAVQDRLDEITVTGADPNTGGMVAGNLSSALSAAQHLGRTAGMGNAPAGTTYIASEINDANACQPCLDVDGTLYDTFDEALANYPTGRYKDCLGQDRCRGMLLAVWPE